MAASNDGGWFSALQFKYISSCSNELLEIENGTTVLKHKFIAKYDNSDNTVLSAISLLWLYIAFILCVCVCCLLFINLNFFFFSLPFVVNKDVHSGCRSGSHYRKWFVGAVADNLATLAWLSWGGKCQQLERIQKQRQAARHVDWKQQSLSLCCIDAFVLCEPREPSRYSSSDNSCFQTSKHVILCFHLTWK